MVNTEMIPILKLSEQSKTLVTPLFQPNKQVMKAAEWKACQDVESIVRDAEEAMLLIRQEMEARIEEQRLEAVERGYEEGFSQVVHELAKVRTERAIMLEKAEHEALDLAFALARRIVGTTIELEPTLIGRIVEQVAQSARGRRSMVIRVHPEDLSLVESQKTILAQSLEGAAIFYDDDATLSRGECVIETEAGRIDGRLETQLSILRRALEKSQ